MNTFLILQIVVSVLLIVAILLQNKEGGLGVVGGNIGGSYHTKRGFEKFLGQVTVILGILFMGISLISLVMIARG